jgi:hypothetical protein
LFETPSDGLSDPFVLNGVISVGRPIEHRTAPLTAEEIAELEVGGFAAWLSSQNDQSTITLNDDPLPELGLKASSSGGPETTPSFTPVGTPNMPVIPGQS